MAPLPAPTASSAFLFLSPPRRSRLHTKHRPRPTVVCSSSAAPTRSLSDQLEPLSRTLLHDKPTPAAASADRPTPQPTWVNPSRPKPTVLSLRRHRRRSPSAHPSAAPLQPLIRAIRALPEDADLAATLDAFFPDPEASPPSASDALLLLYMCTPRKWDDDDDAEAST